MLAGLFKAPTKFAPHVNLPAARARANVVLDNLVEAGFMTEGQVFGARRNPGHPDRPPRRQRAELLSRLGVRRDAQARRHVPEIGQRSLLRRAHRARHQSAAPCRERRRKHAAPARPRLRRQPGRRRDRRHSTAPCAPWSAAATTAPASSTARSTRCASRARRSSPMSTRPRWRTGSRRIRLSSIRRSASATGARTTIPAAFPAP